MRITKMATTKDFRSKQEPATMACSVHFDWDTLNIQTYAAYQQHQKVNFFLLLLRLRFSFFMNFHNQPRLHSPLSMRREIKRKLDFSTFVWVSRGMQCSRWITEQKTEFRFPCSVSGKIVARLVWRLSSYHWITVEAEKKEEKSFAPTTFLIVMYINTWRRRS